MMNFKIKSFKKYRVEPYNVDSVLSSFSNLSIKTNHEKKHESFLFKHFIPDETKKFYTEIIYIATSKNYARCNRFKVGGVGAFKQLKKRLSCYNTRSASGDEWYYCNLFMVTNFRHVEARLKETIGRFRDNKNKEIYVLNYNDLKHVVSTICKNFKNETEWVSSNMSRFIHHLQNDTDCIIPPEIVIHNCITNTIMS